MTESNLKRTVVQSGVDSIAALKEQGLIYRVQEIPIIQEISFYNLIGNQNKIVKLEDFISKDYEVKGISTDIPDDDQDSPDATTEKSYGGFLSLSLRIFSGGKAVNNLSMRLGTLTAYDNALFISSADIWHIKSGSDVSKLTFICTPVYREKSIAIP